MNNSYDTRNYRGIYNYIKCFNDNIMNYVKEQLDESSI